MMMMMIFIIIKLYIWHLFPVSLSVSLSRQSSLSYIVPERSSSRVSVQTYCRYFILGCPTLVCPCEGVHRRTSLKISFLLIQLCLAYLVCHAWMLLEIGRMYLYKCTFVGCCFQELFNAAGSILVQLPFSLFLSTLRQHSLAHLYCRNDTTTVWKKYVYIIGSVRTLHNEKPIDSTFFRKALIDVIFSRWDEATKIHELIH